MARKIIYSSIALVWMVLQIWTRFVSPIHYLGQRYMFIIGCFLLIFFPKKAFPKDGTRKEKAAAVANWAMFAATIALGVYLFTQIGRYTSRWEYVSPVYTGDVLACAALVILLLVGTYRATGWVLTIFVMFCILFGRIGTIWPGILNHGDIAWSTFTDIQMLGGNGIFGLSAGVCAEFILYFVLFGALYSAFGGGDLLTKIGLYATRNSVGGPAKSAVIASSLMGSVSGSAVANVVLTGTFTIPLMKKSGVQPEVAGAVEAAASTGGQILPPVMGAGAFIMAETLGVSYLAICKAAVIPAILYYVAVFIFVHFYSKRMNLGRNAELFAITKKDVLDKIHLLIPMVILVIYIVRGRSVGFACMISMAILIVVAYIRKPTRLSPKQFVTALVDGMEQCASVGIPIFVCGIIIGIAMYSGVALKATNLIVSFGRNNLLLALLLGVFVTILLGMGLPTSAAYVVSSLFLVDVLTECGILPIAAHMFIFYYAVLGQVTPPVAMAGYAGAGIAKANPMRTSWIAFGICMPAFLIPFSFVYNPALVMEGSVLAIVYSFAVTLLGCLFLGLSVSGFSMSELTRRKRLFLRGLLMIAAIMLINSSIVTDVVGISIGIVSLGADFIASRAKKKRIAET